MTYAFAPTGLLALALAGARKVAVVIVPVSTAIRNRLAVQRLADLDDRALKDIGLVRSDVAGALAVPLHVDPSALLADRCGARRDRPGASVLRPAPARSPAAPRSGHLPRAV
jgi:uncharacterized protein YjiS (DUF1127 family)